MNSQEQPKEYRKDEISLSELMEYGSVYFNAICRSWIIILLSGILLAAASAFYFSTKPVLYQARLTFMLDEDGSNQIAGMSGILGQLGVPFMGPRINISKVLELSKSRKIIQDALLTKVEVSERMDYLANHIIDQYELTTRWENYNDEFRDFRFITVAEDSFDRLDNYAIMRLCELVAGTPANRENAFLETDYGQNTAIMSYVVETMNEEISYHLTRELFHSTSDFYIKSSIEKQKNTYDVLFEKRDSVQQIYDELERQYVVLSDRAQGLFTNQNAVKRERIRAEMLQIGSAMSKLEENLAIVEFAIENSTPVLQKIDSPLLPLKEIKTSLTRAILLGIVAGTTIALLGVIFYTFIKLSRASS